MKRRDQEMHQVAGQAFRGQLSRGAIETAGGTAFEGRDFYVWDEDQQTAVGWAAQLAAAASGTPRRTRRNQPPGAPGLSRKEPVK
jgi:hypothetical protein